MKLATQLTGSAAELFDYSGTIPIIDTHEHLMVKEEYYLNTPIRFGNLFNPYIANDLKSSGMPFPENEWAALVVIDENWDAFEPHWNNVKYSSYARPLRIALQKYYGVDDLTRDNYMGLVERINANLKPGIYHRILREDCNIETSIPCGGGLPDKDDPLLKGNISSPTFFCQSMDQVNTISSDVNYGSISDLDSFVEASEAWMKLQKKRGAIQFKSRALPMLPPDKKIAEELFNEVIAGRVLNEEKSFPLMAYVREEVARIAAKIDLPVALHTGVWGDFKENTVMDVIDLAKRNPGTRFDVYHTGIPEVRAATQIAKNFPNTTYNMCWSHIVASDMAISALNEAFDMVPLNKIFAFGADYVFFIEKIFGHLWIARENVSIVLGDRVDRGHIDMEEAKRILKMWFYDNPKAYYRI